MLISRKKLANLMDQAGNDPWRRLYAQIHGEYSNYWD